MVLRRIEGEPLEYVVGWADFCGLRIAVDATVFVPRPRTELLVAEAVALTPPAGVVVDLCCGTGAVGAALAAAVPGIELHASDVQPAAVACARRNLVGPVYEGDLYDALPDSLRGRVDVLTVNAPYVPSDEVRLMPREARLYEELVTLDGGSDGLDLHRRVAAGAQAWLAPGGHLIIETSERQAPTTESIVREAGLQARTVRNEQWDATVVIGRFIP
jgi:release factor glutamine methyltransferase